MPLLIGGQAIAGPKQKLLVLPRDEGDIVFRFIAINDDEEFFKLCPAPTPPRKWAKDKGNFTDTKDDSYLQKLAKWRSQKAHWYFLKSVAPSNITWETVNMDDPETWGNYELELKMSGLSNGERDAIFTIFGECNAVSDEMLIEARERFLAVQAQQPS